MFQFMQWWTVVNTVWQIVANFIHAGGPTVNPAIVANEASKELVRNVANGKLPAAVLNGHENIIQAALIMHPDVVMPGTEKIMQSDKVFVAANASVPTLTGTKKWTVAKPA